MDEDIDIKKTRLSFPEINFAQQLFGEHNQNIQTIAKALDVIINTKGNTLIIEGDLVDVDLAGNILNQLYGIIKEKRPVYPADVDHAIKILAKDSHVNLKDIFLDTVFVNSKKRQISPKNLSQKEYIDAIRNYDMVFGIGPAGTGKTYLAMAMAVESLIKGKVNRIILTRPAVEAGEALGFLPGNLAEKVDPYLRPLYDALHDMMQFEKVSTLMQSNVIEVAPLAFMRGRTLNDAFIILDEAQNTTSEQMKMFLTRIGFSSKAVITGDITQTDLPVGSSSGLVECKNILQNINGIKFVFFSKADVVRHKLVQEIIKAYEDLEERRKNRT
jgi:phosphate starvation-inducible protein PhoH and related proteins